MRTDQRVNRYRSGAKNPGQEVIVSHNDNGSVMVAVVDLGKLTLHQHTFPGQDEGQEGKDVHCD